MNALLLLTLLSTASADSNGTVIGTVAAAAAICLHESVRQRASVEAAAGSTGFSSAAPGAGGVQSAAGDQ